MSLALYLSAMSRAALAWEDASEDVRGARKSLVEASPDLLGPRVAPAARAFLDTWLDEIKTLQTAASDHGDALRETVLLVGQADGDVLERSRQLMSWNDRSISPTGVS